MPERLSAPLSIAQATTDLLLASDGNDDAPRRDLLEPSAMHALGDALAVNGDARSLRLVELSARRANRGASALHDRLSATGDEVELACVNHVATMFRMVAVAASAYQGSAVGSRVPVTRLLADATQAVGEQVTRDSIDRVRYSLLVTQRLLDDVRQDPPASLDLRPAR